MITLFLLFLMFRAEQPVLNDSICLKKRRMMKTICVTKDLAALNRLDDDANHPEDLIEVNLTNHVFGQLWTLGFFDAINKLTGSIIDDFENESITDAATIKKVVESDAFDNFSDKNLEKTAQAIKLLFAEALNRKTGIHFYF